MSATATMSVPRFEYGYVKVKDIQVKTSKTADAKRESVVSLRIGDEEVKPSKRFWTSFMTRFGFSRNIFRYFTHKEVFDRISQRANEKLTRNDTIRFCLERPADNAGPATALAVTNPSAPVITYNDMKRLLDKALPENMTTEAPSYSNGIITSKHQPRLSAEPFSIAGDAFENRYIIDTPIDGYGRPSVYLSLMRLICTNGAIAYSRAFRSELSTGKNDEDIGHSLLRAMDSFNNEEGFAALRQRFDSSQNSWASVRECNRLYKCLCDLSMRSEITRLGRETVVVGSDGASEIIETAMPVLSAFHRMTGDLHELYGVATFDQVSLKRQRVLPARCRVYDMINFMTELATHGTKPRGARVLQAMVGETVGAEYDLEGTAEKYTDFNDFFLQNDRARATASHIRNN